MVFIQEEMKMKNKNEMNKRRKPAQKKIAHGLLNTKVKLEKKIRYCESFLNYA